MHRATARHGQRPLHRRIGVMDFIPVARTSALIRTQSTTSHQQTSKLNIKGNIVEVNFWYNSKVFLGKPFKKHHKSPESYHSLETSTFNSIYCYNMGLVIEINPTQLYVYLLSLHYLIEHDVDRNQCLINNPCPHGSQLCSDRKTLKCEELYLYCYLCGHGWTSHESEITMT